MNLNPISEQGMGFFIEIDEYRERFEKKIKK